MTWEPLRWATTTPPPASTPTVTVPTTQPGLPSSLYTTTQWTLMSASMFPATATYPSLAKPTVSLPATLHLTTTLTMNVPTLELVFTVRTRDQVHNTRPRSTHLNSKMIPTVTVLIMSLIIMGRKGVNFFPEKFQHKSCEQCIGKVEPIYNNNWTSYLNINYSCLLFTILF